MTEVPNEAPTHSVPALTVTRYITEDGEELSPIEEGTNEPREFNGYVLERTDTDGSVTTHVYHKVVTAVPNETPTHELPTLEILTSTKETPETPVSTPIVDKPTAPVTETPVVEVSEATQAQLPNTGESTSILSAIGAGLISMIGLGGIRRKRK